MSRRIEPAGREAAAGVMALIGRVYREYGFEWTDEEEFWDFLGEEYPYEPPRGQLWVVRDGGLIVGSVAVERLDAETAEPHRLYLDPALRGQGLGRALLETAERWAIERGCRRAVLWSDVNFEDAHRLYERAGYVKTGERHVGGEHEYSEYGFERSLVGSQGR